MTNNDISFDRNYIRKNVIPTVKERWPGFSKVMEHNIMLQNSYKNIANDYCKAIFDHIVSNKRVDINVLKSYPEYLHGIFLRYFMSQSINYELSKNELSSILKLFYSDNNDYPKIILKNNKPKDCPPKYEELSYNFFTKNLTSHPLKNHYGDGFH